MRKPFVFALACCALLVSAPAAFAHANLIGADPASGARLERAPSAVVLRFTEQPELSLSDIQVLATDGTRVDDGKVTAGDQPRSLRVGVKQVDKGTYTVAWHVVSKVDGHATAGSYTFGVGTAPRAPTGKAPKAPGPNKVEVAGRFLFIAGLIVLVGGAFFALLVYPVGRARLRTLVLGGAVAGVAGLIVLALAQHEAANASWSALLRTPIGRALVYRAAALGVALIAALFLPRGVAFGTVTAAGVAAMSFEVAAGHAAAEGARFGAPFVQVTAQGIHFVAASVWIGGLAALLVAIRGATSEDKAMGVKRYSTMAGIALAAVVVTGSYRAIGEIGNWHALLHSSYGDFVIAKSVLLLVLAGLGARQRYTHLPKVKHDLRGLRRAGSQELVVATTIFTATAILTALSPPPPSAAANESQVTATGSDFGRTARVRLDVTPGQAGINTFTLHVLNGFRPRTVTLRFTYDEGGSIGPSELDLRRKKDVWTAVDANLSLEGRWKISAILQGATTSAEVPLEIATRCVTQAVPGGKGPVVYTQTLAGGSSDQTYVDPGKTGRNEIHFTFFDAKGNELPLAQEPDISAWRPGHDARSLGVRRFSPGHFIASGRLVRGHWRFDAVATPKGTEGQLRACFEQDI